MLIGLSCALWCALAAWFVTWVRRRAKPADAKTVADEEQAPEDPWRPWTSPAAAAMATNGDDSSSEEEEEEGAEDGDVEEGEDGSASSGASSSGGSEAAAEAAAAAARACKMQFLVLNKGKGKAEKLTPAALWQAVAALAVDNCVKVRSRAACDGHDAPTHDAWLAHYRTWRSKGVTKITLRCDTREAFDDAVARAATEFKLPTSARVLGPATCVACVGPAPAGTLQAFTGSLRLLA